MIITVSVCLVSALVVAISQAKKEKVEQELNAVKDSYMSLQEDNRVLNTCLETMESEIENSKGNISPSSRDLADELARKEKSISHLVYDRDHYKRMYDQTWEEKNAYKKMLESTKKASQ
jgi:chromosome segregation ATPase